MQLTLVYLLMLGFSGATLYNVVMLDPWGILLSFVGIAVCLYAGVFILMSTD